MVLHKEKKGAQKAKYRKCKKMIKEKIPLEIIYKITEISLEDLKDFKRNLILYLTL